MAVSDFERRLLRDLTERNLTFWQKTGAQVSEEGIATLIKDNGRMQQAIATALAEPDLWDQTVDTLLDIFVYIERMRLQREWAGWLQATLEAAPAQDNERYCLLLNRYGQMKRYLEGKSNIAEAFALHNRALTLAKELHNPSLEALSHFQLAEDYRMQGENNRAVTAAEEVVRISSQHEIPLRYLASTHSTLGLAHLNLIDFSQALHHFRRAHALFSAEKVDFEIGNSLLNWGVALANQGDMKGALQKYEEAGQVYSKIGALYNLYLLKINQGSIHYRLGDFAAADRAFQSVNTTYLLENGHHFHLAMTAHGLGDVAHARGNPEAALPYLTEAAHQWRKLNHPLRLAYTLATREGVHLDLGLFTEAAEDHREAAALIAQNPEHLLAIEAQQVLNKWQEKRSSRTTPL